MIRLRPKGRADWKAARRPGRSIESLSEIMACSRLLDGSDQGIASIDDVGDRFGFPRQNSAEKYGEEVCARVAEGRGDVLNSPLSGAHALENGQSSARSTWVSSSQNTPRYSQSRHVAGHLGNLSSLRNTELLLRIPTLM